MKPSYVFSFAPEFGFGQLVFTRHHGQYSINVEHLLRDVLGLSGNVKWCCNSACIGEVFADGAHNEGYFYAMSIRQVLKQLYRLGLVEKSLTETFWRVFHAEYTDILQRQIE